MSAAHPTPESPTRTARHSLRAAPSSEIRDRLNKVTVRIGGATHVTDPNRSAYTLCGRRWWFECNIGTDYYCEPCQIALSRIQNWTKSGVLFTSSTNGKHSAPRQPITPAPLRSAPASLRFAPASNNRTLSHQRAPIVVARLRVCPRFARRFLARRCWPFAVAHFRRHSRPPAAGKLWRAPAASPPLCSRHRSLRSLSAAQGRISPRHARAQGALRASASRPALRGSQAPACSPPPRARTPALPVGQPAARWSADSQAPLCRRSATTNH
jgi:hypothetical protein